MQSVDASIEPTLPPDPHVAGQAIDAPLGEVRANLDGRAMRATWWTIVFYGATQALRMGNNLIITRLLLPRYFGLMALSTALVVGMTLLSDVGLLPSVINSPRGDDPVFLNTAWTIQIIRGVILWLVSLSLALPLALLYHDREIRVLLPVLGLSMIFSGFASTNLLRASRNMEVRRLFLIELTAQLIGIVVTVIWALRDPSVWALVGGTLVAAAIKSVFSHVPFFVPGERNALAWDPTCVGSLIHFGKWIMMGTAFYFFGSQSDRLILGKLISFSLLGVYNIAFTIADIPRQVIQQFSYRVAFPFVAKMAHLPLPEFSRNVLRYRFYVLCAGALILSVVVNGGGWFVLELYDSRYAAAGWMVPILALGLWHTLLYTTTGDVLFALGKPKYNAIGTGCYCVTMVIGLPIAFHYGGMVGAVICVAAGDFPYYIVLETGAAREKVSVWRQDALATLVFALICGSGFLLQRRLLSAGAARPGELLKMLHKMTH